MNVLGRLGGLAAGALGVAAVGSVAGLARQKRLLGRRVDDHTAFGSLRSPPVTVIAEDGVPLRAEVDEVEPGAAYRGLVRAVYYDQRSHGRSGRSNREHSTIDQLGRDLGQVIDALAPEGPVVLVGHSMGGMTVVALAEQRPELFGDKVVGIALISTTAGGLDPSRLLLPMLPARISGDLAARTVSTLAVGHRLVDGVRRVSRSVAQATTDVLAFGDDVPVAYVDFVDSMLSATPFEVVAEFFPSFRGLDKFDAVEVMSRVPTTIICGTADRLTSVGHSRKLHVRIEGSTLLECDNAGHMVILERYGQVNAALDQLLTAAADRSTKR